MTSILLRKVRDGRPGKVIEHGDLRIDGSSRVVTIRGEVVETTPMEFDLLQFLAANPSRVFTRSQLLVKVWDSSAEWQQTGTVTEHVRRLRAKIEPDFRRPTRVITVRGVGYRYERGTADSGLRSRGNP